VPDLGLLPEGGRRATAPASFNSLYFWHPAQRADAGLLGSGGDRLFKIRHCMNIEGVERQLALSHAHRSRGAGTARRLPAFRWPISWPG